MILQMVLGAVLSLFLVTAVEAKEDFNCKVQVTTKVQVDLLSSSCLFPLSKPHDCVHAALVGTGGYPAYVTLSTRNSSGVITGYFPVWGESFGWFHLPQFPLYTPSLNHLTFVNGENSPPQSVRIAGTALMSGEHNCP